MGVLRFLLALAVVFAHTAPPFGLRMTFGTNSVQAFYIVSGFLITLVLNKKYDQSRAFYEARFFRIFPAYWVFLLMEISIQLAQLAGAPLQSMMTLSFFQQNWDVMQPLTKIYLAFSNIFLFGQDATLFVGMDADGALYFTPNFRNEPHQVYHYLFVQQAWSLPLELAFYLIAPFCVRRVPVVLALLGASLVARAWLYQQGFSNDPWTYRFFPIEIGTFLLGSLSCHLYLAFERRTVPTGVAAIAVVTVWLATILFQFLPQSSSVTSLFTDGELLYYSILVLMIPVLFKATSRNRVDRFLGELSFPIYLGHFIAKNQTGMLVSWLSLPDDPSSQAICTALMTIALAVVVVVLIESPLERWRARRISRHSGVAVMA